MVFMGVAYWENTGVLEVFRRCSKDAAFYKVPLALLVPPHSLLSTSLWRTIMPRLRPTSWLTLTARGIPWLRTSRPSQLPIG